MSEATHMALLRIVRVASVVNWLMTPVYIFVAEGSIPNLCISFAVFFLVSSGNRVQLHTTIPTAAPLTTMHTTQP